MREIKFKAKIKGDAGVYPVWVIDWYLRKAFIERACGTEWVDLDKIQSFLQYTGLKDKNGVEIYEGDIVDTGMKTMPHVGEIVIANGPRMCTQIRDGGEYLRIHSMAATQMTLDGKVEVIGNIYESPELMEEES